MSLLRLLVAWIVMAALPLQGLAAASMLFCGAAPAASSAHADHHGADGGHHAHAAASGHEHAAAGHHGAPGDGQEAAEAGHSCPICASCCQLMAVGGFEALPQVSAAPAIEPSAPPVRVTTRAASVPDKPPRA